MATDFRSRDAGPLTAEEWRSVELAAIETARHQLIGRRFLALYGPLGSGVEFVELDLLGPPRAAAVSLQGDEDAPPLRPARRRILPLPLLYRDCLVFWRDLERARMNGAGLETSAIVAAAAEVAAAEDQLIFHGNPELGIEGLLTAADTHAVQLGDWNAAGEAYQQVVRAVAQLQQAGHPGPYALVLSSDRFARLERVHDMTGTLELVAVERLVRGPVLPCPVISGGVLLDPSAANMDLAVGIDLTVAYADNDQMNHRLRVLETVVLRLKRPSAVLRLVPSP
ncbi:MAG: family 1 encapsulin nanocompartment shell protein [Myxococcales bacterium]|nr:bacteriocin family protein [Myxococcota bacterium]MDW8283855.1 family 1 encapsulin nanocompartment shell protein [Myxococcales bacterium]